LSKKRSVLVPDEEFQFQPKLERSNGRHGFLRMGPRVRVGATLVASFNGEE